MILANLTFLICYTELLVCGYMIYTGRRFAKKDWGLIALGLLCTVWSLGQGIVMIASSPWARFLGNCLLEGGTLFTFAVLPYYLNHTLPRRRRIFQRIFWAQIAITCVVLPLYVACGAMQLAAGRLSENGWGYHLLAVYKVCVLAVMVGAEVYAAQRFKFRRNRFRSRVVAGCLALGLVLEALDGTVADVSPLGCFLQFAIFITLCALSLRFPVVIGADSVATYIQESLRSPFVVLAPDNTVQLVNNSGEELLGSPQRKLVGRDIRECVRFLDEYRPIAVTREGNTMANYDAVTHGGVLCRLEMTYVYDYFGEVLSAIIVMSDVTEQVRMIHQLEESRVQAEQASAAKSAFLANTSHEIRTPMNAVMGLAELLGREPLPPGAMEHVRGIRQASDNLLSIINDLLDFSKIESGKMEIVEGPYQLGSLLNDVISIVRTRLTDRPVLFAANVDCSLPSVLCGDEVRMRQVLMNLLNNAAKYTRQGSITLTVAQRGRLEGTINLVFSIQDTGIGIKQENLERIFGDFERFDTTANRAVEGTGLGLPISQKLSRAMGGEITVESEYGKGSVFTFVVPQGVQDEAALASLEEPQGKSVLLLENRDIYAQSIGATVRGLGAACRHVRTQGEFFQALRESPYTLVFAPSAQYNGARRIMERLGATARLVLLAEFGEIAAPEQSTLSLPAWCVPVAQVLSGQAMPVDYYADPHKAISFVAPAARVLVVDDLYTNLKVAEGLMAPYQMQVDLCQSGPDAVTMALAGEYDIIFMDHMMPGMDGVEAAQIIRRQRGRYQTLPIVALTANAVSGMKEMYLAAGLDDFLAKPIDTAKLNALLEMWLPPHKKQRYTPDGPAPGARAPLSIAELDTARGLVMAGGSQSRYEENLRAIALEMPDRIRHLRQCMQDGDLPLYTITVHALKSALAAVGAQPLSDRAAKLEAAGHKGDMAVIAAHNEDFLARLLFLTERINLALPALPRLQQTAASDDDLAGLPQALAKLEKALEVMDAGEVEKNMARLRQKAWPDRMEQTLAAVEGRIAVYDYAEARRLLGKPPT